MKPVQPEELSALLDNEVEPRRAQEIQDELDSNKVLRVQFESLKRWDEEFSKAADTAVFAPSVQLPTARTSKVPDVAIELMASVLASFMMLVRVVCKIFDVPELTWGLNSVAFVAMLTATIWLLRTTLRSSETADAIPTGGGS